MKTPNLIDVPKSAPSRRAKLKAFKAQHGIETHNAGSSWGNGRWIACHMPSARKFNYGVTDKSDFFDCQMKVCRLLDESGVNEYGNTEREAIRGLCDNLEIPCSL